MTDFSLRDRVKDGGRSGYFRRVADGGPPGINSLKSS
jgi:hypothetical protein